MVRSFDGDSTRSSALTVGAGLTLLGAFGPWLWSGSSRRSSFELLDLADRLGFASSGLFVWAIRPWPLMPLLIVTAVVATWTGRSMVAAVVGATMALYVTSIALAVLTAPDVGLIRVGWGAGVSIAGGLCLLASSCWIAMKRPSR